MSDRSIVPADRDVRAALARAPGRKKLDLVLDAPDPGALVRSLPAEDLYLAIQEIGPADAAPLVQLATPAQFRTFVDLDAWKGDELRPERVHLWIRLARGDDEDVYREKLAGLDMEVVELLLRALVRIHDTEEDGEFVEDVEGTVERSPEGRFLLIFPAGGAEYGAAKRVIDELYAEDPFRAARLLYAVRWELESDLSEEAYRWRNARLADLGFPSPEEAASLYARVDLRQPPAVAAPAAPAEEPPGFFLASLETGSLLDRALAAVPPSARDAVEGQLIALVNMALVADRIDVSEPGEVRAAAQAVRDGLAVGLAHLAGDDAAVAAGVLAAHPLKRLFQVGFTRGLELAWTARRLVSELPLRLDTTFLPDEPLGSVLEALLRKRPLFHEGLAGVAPTRATWPVAAVVPPASRPFAALDEVERTATALERIRLQAEVFAEGGLELPRLRTEVLEAEGEVGLARVRFSDLFLTAALRAAAGEPFVFAPLPAARLAAALEKAFDPAGALRPEFRAGAEDALAAAGAIRSPAHEAEARTLARAALERLEAELGPQVAAGGVDPRLAAPAIVSAGQNSQPASSSACTETAPT